MQCRQGNCPSRVGAKRGLSRPVRRRRGHVECLAAMIEESDFIAWIRSSEIDLSADYLQRGRIFSSQNMSAAKKTAALAMHENAVSSSQGAPGAENKCYSAGADWHHRCRILRHLRIP